MAFIKHITLHPVLRGACLYRIESQIDIDSPTRNGSNFPKLHHHPPAFVKNIEIKYARVYSAEYHFFYPKVVRL